MKKTKRARHRLFDERTIIDSCVLVIDISLRVCCNDFVTHTHTHTQTHTHIHIHNAHTYTHIHTQTYTQIHTNTHTHAHTSTETSILAQGSIHDHLGTGNVAEPG